MSDVKVVLSLGSNCGDRRNAVSEAIEWLKTQLSGVVSSDIYETLPVGHNGSCYMNAVVGGCFDGEVTTLEGLCKAYEAEHGRDSEARMNSKVPIDIDIVIVGDKVVRQRDFRCNFFQIGFSSLSFSGLKS